jgi:anti-anti-sigma factor
MLSLSWSVSGDRADVALVGEMDTSTADEVDHLLLQLDAAGIRSVVLDVGALDFVDSSGLRVLLRGHDRADARGGSLALRSRPAFVQRLLAVTGLDDLFPGG